MNGTWTSRAQPAVFMKPAWIEAAQARIAALPPDERQRVQGALVKVAAQESSNQGITQAITAIEATLRALHDPSYAGSGDTPAMATLREAAALALQGMAFETATTLATQRDATQAAQLFALVDGASCFDATQRRKLHTEVNRALGSDLAKQARAAGQ